MKESLQKEDKGDLEISSLSYTLELINKINKDFKDFYRKIINEFKEYQLTIPQYCVLRHLGKFGGLQLGELASYCHLSRSTMTGVIDTMEKKKVVVRAKNLKDKRSLFVILTEKGKQIFNKIPKQEILSDSCEALNSEEIQQMNESLLKVSQIFEPKKKISD